MSESKPDKLPTMRERAALGIAIGEPAAPYLKAAE